MKLSDSFLTRMVGTAVSFDRRAGTLDHTTASVAALGAFAGGSAATVGASFQEAKQAINCTRVVAGTVKLFSGAMFFETEANGVVSNNANSWYDRVAGMALLAFRTLSAAAWLQAKGVYSAASWLQQAKDVYQESSQQQLQTLNKMSTVALGIGTLCSLKTAYDNWQTTTDAKWNDKVFSSYNDDVSEKRTKAFASVADVLSCAALALSNFGGMQGNATLNFVNSLVSLVADLTWVGADAYWRQPV